jgi:hypothetical protein
LCSTREEATAVARGDLEIVICSTCSHAFNTCFDERLADYTGAYENSLHYSPTFRDYAEQQADDLIRRYGLRGKQVIEIGCGDAYFLRLLCVRGNNRGLGFEPRTGEDVLQAGDDISIVQDYYSEKYSHAGGDLVCCRQVLEHIPDPIRFLTAVHRALGGNPDAVVFFEVPNASCLFRERRVWDVLYEHFSYFTPASLQYAFAQAGFEVRRIQESFGGQYLCIEAVRTEAGIATTAPAASADQYVAQALEFSQDIAHRLSEWQFRLRSEQGNVAVWGAGSKGSMFLNLVDGSDAVRFVIDVNPRKHGMYIAGTGHRIQAPHALGTAQGLSVLLMNPLYEQEVRQMVDGLGVQAQVYPV